MAQECDKTKLTSTMLDEWENLSNKIKQGTVSNVARVGTAQQCNMTRYTSAMFQNWVHLRNTRRRGSILQSFVNGNISAIQQDRVHKCNDLGLGIFQQCTMTGYTQQCSKTGNISVKEKDSVYISIFSKLEIAEHGNMTRYASEML